MNAPGYSGPNIHLAIIQPVEEDTRSDSEIIQSLYQEIGEEEKYQESTYDLGNAFSPWLRRLNFMSDFQIGGNTKTALAKNVIKYLELTHENVSFKDVFQCAITEAIQTCGDRMSLSILYLGIQYQLATTSLSDVQETVNLLVKGVWTLNLLEDLARHKASSVDFASEVEVYLAYPVMLKEQLEIPIDVTDMLYFTCSAVTEEELIAAEQHVKRCHSNREKKLKFLTEQDRWIETLKHHNQNAVQALQDKRLEDFEAGVSESECQNAYNQGLVEMTKDILLI